MAQIAEKTTSVFFACKSYEMRPPPSGCRCCADISEGWYLTEGRYLSTVIVG